MRRLHGFEIHESSRCPESLRDAITDTVRFYTEWAAPFRRIEGRLAQALVRCGETRVLDLCSGAGGPWPEMLARMRRRTGTPLEVVLTDAHPNRFAAAGSGASSGLVVRKEPLDARSVPAGLPGCRTFFSCFHHLRPAEARRVLADAAAAGVGVGIFEAQRRSPWSLALFLLYVPLTLLAVPLVRPFRLSRLLWTYLLPVLPIAITLDAWVSAVRTYESAELADLAADAAGDRMEIDCGRVSGGRIPVDVTYLVAVPRR